MSNLLGRKPTRDMGRTLPKGETVGSYSSYLDAQKAVDYLADQQFPVQLVSIIGNDLKTVERVTGRLTYPRVALSGALSGAWFGLFVGLLLSLFGGGQTYATIISSIGLGVCFWVLFGIIGYAMQRGKRDFTSTSQVIAASYDVIVAPEASGDAKRLLQQLPMTQTPTAARTPGGYPGGHQTPQRPTGWQDPYGQPPAGPAQGPYGQQHQGRPGPYGTPSPPQGESAQDGSAAAGKTAGAVPGAAAPDPEDEQKRTAQGPQLGSYPDLPDGRPQYGERLPESGAAQHGAAQHGPDQQGPNQQGPAQHPDAGTGAPSGSPAEDEDSRGDGPGDEHKDGI